MKKFISILSIFLLLHPAVSFSVDDEPAPAPAAPVRAVSSHCPRLSPAMQVAVSIIAIGGIIDTVLVLTNKLSVLGGGQLLVLQIIGGGLVIADHNLGRPISSRLERAARAIASATNQCIEGAGQLVSHCFKSRPLHETAHLQSIEVQSMASAASDIDATPGSLRPYSESSDSSGLRSYFSLAEDAVSPSGGSRPYSARLSEFGLSQENLIP